MTAAYVLILIVIGALGSVSTTTAYFATAEQCAVAARDISGPALANVTIVARCELRGVDSQK